MDKISTLIVDDESAARKKLCRLLANDQRVEVVGEAEDGLQAIELIRQHKPQLVLLDIQMPSISGFDVLRLIPDEELPMVIFVTAFDEYAIKAFEVCAIDYLLKPFGQERLDQAIIKAQQTLQGSVSSPAYTPNREVLSALSHDGYARQLAVHTHKRIRLINVEDISHIISEHRLINIYDNDNERYWTNETLQQLETRLDPQQFFRIHRSSLINLKASFELETWEDGRLRVHFPHEVSLTVAREPAKELRKRLGF